MADKERPVLWRSQPELYRTPLATPAVYRVNTRYIDPPMGSSEDIMDSASPREWARKGPLRSAETN